MKRTVVWKWSLIFTALVFGLGCRTVDMIAQLRATPTATVTRVRPTATAISSPTATIEIVAQVVESEATPTRPPPPTQPPPPPTSRPVVRPTVRIQNAESRPRPTSIAQPAAPPSPTSQFYYQVAESRCGPNVRTFIEGYVYENGSLKDGVLVRISQGPDGLADPNEDYRTGSDPHRRGYYFHNINSNAPHGGTWYVWVIDPETQQRISVIAIVKTDSQRVEDTDSSAGSCQSATVSFSNQGARRNVRTATHTPTRRATRTVTPTATPTEE